MAKKKETLKFKVINPGLVGVHLVNNGLMDDQPTIFMSGTNKSGWVAFGNDVTVPGLNTVSEPRPCYKDIKAHVTKVLEKK